jgi:signal transduction histidine kinase/ligand-binding sensor domain-containing protein
MHKYLTILLVICLCYDGISQQYPLVHYTPKDGLVNSRVRKVYQDSKGRLYFLSYGGLSVYDGNRFKNYTIQNGLAADMVNDILEVGDDSLLVAPNINEMNLLVRGQMTKFTPIDNFSPTINFFLKCNNGNIYITADQGLFMLKGNKFEKIDVTIPNSVDAPFLGAVTDWNDYLVFSTNDLRNNKGLYLLNKKSQRLTDMKPDSFINSLDKDKSGKIWLSTNNGIYTLDTASLRKGLLKFQLPENSYRHVTAYPNSLLAFEDNRIWMIDKTRDLIKAGEDGILLKIRLLDQFPGITVQSLFIDKENIAWICTGENGVIKLAGTNLTIAPLTSGKNVPFYIHRATYLKDTTWFIVNNNNLVRKTKEGIQSFATNMGQEIHLVEQRLGKIIIADYNFIYEAAVPTNGENRIVFNAVYTSPKGIMLGVEHLLDNNGILFLSTSKSLAVLRNNKLLYQFPIGPTDAVEAIRLDSIGRLWLTTRSLGLVVFNVHPNDPEHFLEPAFRFGKEVTNISPRSMVFDKKGNIWIGTRFNGITAFKFDGSNLIPIHHFQVQKGLTDNFITSLACDSSNNIVAGSPTGLDRLIATSNNEYRIENITKSNNIFGSFDNVWVDHNKVIHGIMGTNSLLQYSPVAFNKPYIPQLFIEEVKVNGQPYSYYASNSFSYNQRNISLTLAAPAFLNEKQVQYTYRLLGTDNDQWSEASTNANINLINLSSGKYTLEVKAFFPSTPYASQEIAYHFTITPPWWESWVFRIVAAVVLIGMVYFIVRFYYRRKMEKQRVILEKQKAIEIERTRIAHDIHDDLGAGLSTIRFLSEKVKLNPSSENTKTDIEKMQSTSYDLMEKMNEIIWAMNEKNDTLEDLLFYTRAYAKEYSEENDLQCSFDIPENIPLLFVSGEVRRNVFLSVKESLHNIVKHAYASEVRIQIAIDKSLCIKVQDNGRGLEAKSFTLNGGNGLQIMQKRMVSIGGSLNINYENGTSVEMEVPLHPPTP